MGRSKDDASCFGYSVLWCTKPVAHFVGMHGSLKRQAIMMPAMSPLMTEGTITRWKKKEGEAFAAGDVLLQIVRYYAFLRICANAALQESDIAMIDVEAHTPGILGKILVSLVVITR